MPDAAELARLRQAFAGEYVIVEYAGELLAWRHDGTTPVVRADSLPGLRAGIAANRRVRHRIAA